MSNSIQSMWYGKNRTSMCRYAMTKVTIEDTGPGFEPETHERLFEPFHTSKADGIGMGLAISLSIIEAHGGCWWSEADAASGAIFPFTLPSRHSE